MATCAGAPLDPAYTPFDQMRAAIGVFGTAIDAFLATPPAPPPTALDAADTSLSIARFIFAGLSREPSQAELRQAVVQSWADSHVTVAAVDKISCYAWTGAYSGHGNPRLCRYSVDFGAAPQKRDVLESVFDNADADHWYLTNISDAAAAEKCDGCGLNTELGLPPPRAVK